MLIYIIVIPLLVLYVVGSGLLDTEFAAVQVSTIILVIALGLFSFVLVWGGERWGFIAATVVGIIAVVGITANIALIARGKRPAAFLITNVPGVVFGVALVAAGLLGWVG